MQTVFVLCAALVATATASGIGKEVRVGQALLGGANYLGRPGAIKGADLLGSNPLATSGLNYLGTPAIHGVSGAQLVAPAYGPQLGYGQQLVAPAYGNQLGYGQQLVAAPAYGQQLVAAPAYGQQLVAAPAYGQQLFSAPYNNGPLVYTEPLRGFNQQEGPVTDANIIATNRDVLLNNGNYAPSALHHRSGYPAFPVSYVNAPVVYQQQPLRIRPNGAALAYGTTRSVGPSAVVNARRTADAQGNDKNWLSYNGFDGAVESDNWVAAARPSYGRHW